MTSHADLLSHLLPQVSYDSNGARLAAELGSEGAALDRAVDSTDQVKSAITPGMAGTFLPDWERVSGITPSSGATYQERLAAVLAKMAETGGLSIAYFTKIASRLGYTIRIVEPEPFRAGTSRAGDRLNPWPDITWFWRVEVLSSNGNAWRFRAGQSCAGERLLSFGDSILESIINDLKPADTYCDFAYLES